MTATIRVTRSNRSELLMEQLAVRLQESPADPFAPELILVQGRGMGVWLNMQLSRRLGICANIDYVYPRHFIERAFASVLDELRPDQAMLPALLSSDREQRPGKNQFTRELMQWGVLKLLDRSMHRTEYAPLARYLEHDIEGVRAYGLARQISRCFDEYLTYRTDLLRAWSKAGTDSTSQLALFSTPNSETWQSALFRELEQALGDTHTAALEQQFLNALRRRKPGSTTLSRLPSRLSVFGLSVLPPLYLRVLAALSRHVEITIFQLSPTRHFFGDLAAINPKQELASEHDNRLLLAYGKLGAEMQQSQAQEFEAAQVAETEHALFEKATSSSLLARIQNDILEHTNPTPGAPINPGTDQSLQFSSCHSMMREVEVLHGQLLHLLNDDSDLGPQDVLVMMPNVEEYAPVIDAVFGRAKQDPLFVPYRIADRGLVGTSAVADALLRILKLVDGRATAPEIIDLLALRPVRLRQGIATQDLDRITELVGQSGVRWGWDAKSRAEKELPAVADNSWEFGLDRLLLGYAIDAEDHACTAGVLPFAELEGKEALLLGQLAAFVRQLRDACRKLAAPRPPKEWQTELLRVLALFTETDQDSAWEQQEVHTILSEIAAETSAADFDLPLSLSVIQRLVSQRLTDKPRVGAFLSGGVTMCALTPMRSIPFRVVVLLGMSEGAFPRQTNRPDFNLLHTRLASRRPGDPDRQQDDRYLFLEALLAARERLLISYIGQSVRDNAKLAPSIVVTELQEYIKERYSGSQTQEAQEDFLSQWVVLHPLQPFSPRYFDGKDPQLFSFESAYLGAAEQLQTRQPSPSPLVTHPLPSGETLQTTQLQELVEFLSSPAKFFLRHSLGIYLGDGDRQLKEQNPVALEPLEQYQVGEHALAWLQLGASEQDITTSLRATGLVTHGTPGSIDIETAMKAARPIAARLADLKQTPLTPHSFALAHGPQGSRTGLLRGSLHSLFDRGQVLGQFGRVNGKSLLRAWAQHLALSACPLPHKDTWLLGRPPRGKHKLSHAVKRLTPVDQPISHLASLVNLLKEGRAAPTLLFPEASLKFVQLVNSGKDSRTARDAVEKTFAEELSYSASLQRLYTKNASLKVVNDSRLGPSFEECSLQVFEPLLNHLKDAE